MSENKLLEDFRGDSLAVSVWVDKYAADGEEHYDNMHRRMAREFARVEYYNRNYLENGGHHKLSELGQKIWEDAGNKSSKEMEEDIFQLFKDFKYIIPQGSIMSSLGTNKMASLSNCWLISPPEDSYGGIMKADSELVYYYKRRGGVGVDISKLRPDTARTNNTANSSTGAVSFMHRFSNTTREVAMAGRK